MLTQIPHVDLPLCTIYRYLSRRYHTHRAMEGPVHMKRSVSECQNGANMGGLTPMPSGWRMWIGGIERGRSTMEQRRYDYVAVSYTHLRAHETDSYLVCR